MSLDITVTTAAGTSGVSASDQFIYVATYARVSTQQYRLADSDGTTWVDMDPAGNLTQVVTPAVDSTAVLGGNSDLWTKVAGFNQDIGIDVNGTIVAWKESGGFAGTFSPNAAFVQTVISLAAGVSYTIKLRWKTNKPALGATIFAGAGPISGQFSPTRLTVQILPKIAAAVQTAVSTKQYRLADSDGTTWMDLDASALVLVLTPTSDMTAILSGNSDLWTKNAGYNQDVAIDVNGLVVAWKESGGFAGTFSPNAAFVQTVISLTAGTTYTVKLRWKANKAAVGATIFAGAGPIGGLFSPTRLTAQLSPSNAGSVQSAVTTKQYRLADSDGVTWVDMDTSSLSLTLTPRTNMTVVLGVNSDLWTKNAGFNQDIGIDVNGSIVAWKESGGFAGTFSPNAAFVQTTIPVTAGTTYAVKVRWKTNKAATGATIFAGAGPISGQFSPTSLSVQSPGSLVFADEFNGTALDATAWVALNRPGDGGNGEVGCYTPGNTALTNGSLVITTKADTSCAGYSYTSGMVQWKSYNLLYGTVEIRAKMAGGKGTWPALWMLGANCQQTNVITPNNVPPCNWPTPGSDEIDMTEVLGGDLTHVNQQIHSGSNNGGCSGVPTTDVSQNWHTYKLIWQPGSLTWLIDGAQTCSITTGVPTTPMFLILNTAVGGVGGGTVDSTTLPQTSSIDYVHVYQAPLPPRVVSTSPLANGTSAPTTGPVTATFSKSIVAGSIQMSMTGPGSANLPGAVAYDDTTFTASFQPTAALAAGTIYTANVSAATDHIGFTLAAPVIWSFTTAVCCSVFPSNAVPTNITVNDPNAIEVGMKFSADVAGKVNGVRFYKSSSNTGTHVGNLWSSAGTLLATATFANESATGWQQANFSAPVAITAGSMYVISYHTTVGFYSADAGGLANAVDNPPLHAVANSVSPDGVYVYGASAFPNQTGNGTNYWVDVIFNATVVTGPPAVTTTSPVPNATGAPYTGGIGATFNKAVLQSSIQFTLSGPGSITVPSVLTYNAATLTATLTPSAALALGTAYTATVSGATDTSGTPMTAPYSWNFTTIACPCSLFAPSSSPTTIANDSAAVEVGMKFIADIAGTVTGVRFYKAATNTGTHVGNLWSSTGTLLATITFSGESASGWQQATFATPVVVAAGTTYVISYHTNVGHYAADAGAFTTAVDNAPLHAVANSVSPNGVYIYGATSQFPTQSFNAANYWVDLVFIPS